MHKQNNYSIQEVLHQDSERESEESVLMSILQMSSEINPHKKKIITLSDTTLVYFPWNPTEFLEKKMIMFRMQAETSTFLPLNLLHLKISTVLLR